MEEFEYDENPLGYMQEVGARPALRWRACCNWGLSQGLCVQREPAGLHAGGGPGHKSWLQLVSNHESLQLELLAGSGLPWPLHLQLRKPQPGGIAPQSVGCTPWWQCSTVQLQAGRSANAPSRLPALAAQELHPAAGEALPLWCRAVFSLADEFEEFEEGERFLQYVMRC